MKCHDPAHQLFISRVKKYLLTKFEQTHQNTYILLLSPYCHDVLYCFGQMLNIQFKIRFGTFCTVMSYIGEVKIQTTYLSIFRPHSFIYLALNIYLECPKHCVLSPNKGRNLIYLPSEANCFCWRLKSGCKIIIYQFIILSAVKRYIQCMIQVHLFDILSNQKRIIIIKGNRKLSESSTLAF